MTLSPSAAQTHTHLHTCGEKAGFLKTLLLDSSHLGQDALSLADEQFGGTDAVQTVRKTTQNLMENPHGKIYRFVHFVTFC